MMMSCIRSLVYKMGFRPKPGTILYSPSRHYLLAAMEAWKDFDPFKCTILDKDTRRWVDLVDWLDSNAETKLND